MNDIIASGISSLFGGGIVALLVSAYIRRIFARMDALEQTVTRLKDKQIAGIDERLAAHIRNDKTMTHTQKLEIVDELKNKLERHIDNDRSQESLTEVKHIRGTLIHLEAKVDTIANETAEQRAKIVANKEYIKNLDASFQMYKHNKPM